MLETIQVQDGIPQRLPLHQARMDASYSLYFGAVNPILLSELIALQDTGPGVFRWRILYGKEGYRQEVLPYQRKEVRTLTLLEVGDLAYPLKFSDRSCFSDILSKIRTDDVILLKQGSITDASYANLAFREGNKWFTPANPLLAGTRRQELLDSGRILTADLRREDIPRFSVVCLINAFLDLGDLCVPVTQISNSDL